MNKHQQTLVRCKPLFIGGCSRSGTTMLGAMLGTHRQAVTTPESQFKIQILKIYGAQISCEQLENLKRFLNQDFRLKLWDISFPDNLTAGKDQYDFNRLMYDLVSLYASNVGKSDWSFWIDHTPTNIDFVPQLLDQFPNAKFIHVVRDGRGVANSIIPLDWGPNSVISAAEYWLKGVAMGLAAQIRYPEQVITVRYEDLVDKSEETLKRLCQFIELPFDDKMLEGNGFKVPYYSRVQHKLVGQKPELAASECWRLQLPKRSIEIFESRVGNMLDYLGYDLLYGLKARSPTRLERLASGDLKLSIKSQTNKCLNWIRRIRC